MKITVKEIIDIKNENAYIKLNIIAIHETPDGLVITVK
jgi:hypothetical protein